jgi:phospholipid/cholesterol/gamma-HCH transport system permease protein
MTTFVRTQIERSGALVLDGVDAGRDLFSVFVRTLSGTVRGRREPGEVARQMFQIGNRSLLFVAVTLGMLGMVLVFQTCLQVNRVTGDLSQVGAEFMKVMVHEFGPTLTAMMLATRVGAGIAAEVGSMVVTEQVDALRMCGVDEVDYLIVPRFVACVLMMIALYAFAVVVAFSLGALTAYTSFHVNPLVFVDPSKVVYGDLAIGLTKCVAYGAAIPVVSGYCGLSARGGSEGVGWATTRAVIGSSFAVILLDFILSGLGFVLLQAGQTS